jgi:uncharacterized membrane protein YkoI
MNTAKKTALGAAMLIATVTGGAVGASMVGVAGAQTNPTTTTTASADQSTTAKADTETSGTDQADRGPHEANGKTETELTGDDATKAKEAALAAVPGGTVERVETDADGATYEAHVTKSDGSKVTVKMDADFKVTEVAEGNC